MIVTSLTVSLAANVIGFLGALVGSYLALRASAIQRAAHNARLRAADPAQGRRSQGIWTKIDKGLQPHAGWRQGDHLLLWGAATALTISFVLRLVSLLLH